MYGKKEVSSATLLALVLLLLIFISLQSLVNYEIGQVGRNLVGKATGIGSGQVSICINNQPTINISSCTNNITAGEIYYCNVTAKDLDNNSLAFSDYTPLFNINTLTGEINFTPTNANSGTYNFLISVQDNRGCSNSQNSDNFSLTISEVEEETEEETPPAPPPTPSGGGGGAAPSIPGFNIDYEELSVLIKVDRTTERIIKVSNTGDISLDFTIDVGTLDEFIDVSEAAFSLVSGGSKYVTLYFNSLGKPAGLYNGEILFKGGSLEITLPIVIEIESLETALDVKIEIPENFKELVPGESISAKISMFNLGDVRPIDVIVDYFIKDMEGNIVVQWSENISITEGKSFIRSPTLPAELVPGMYVFYMEVRYDETVAVSGSLFEVKKEKRVEMPATLENKLIAFQVWQAVKRTYGGPFMGLMTIMVLILVGLALNHYMVLKSMPRSHKRRINEIHEQLQKETLKERKKEKKREMLKKKLGIIEDAYRLKHISKKAYDKTNKDIKDAIDKI